MEAKNNNLKIFLAYHKNSPLYKSDVFEPIQVGADCSEEDLGILKDNTDDNISELNPYYCELTGHYWVLKNYIQNSKEEYIGFAHYRRLPDLLNISKNEVPSIYGLGYADAVKLFEEIKNCDLSEYTVEYDTKSLDNEDSLGILLCGTGIGMSIAANKVKGIRAARCTTLDDAHYARIHNGANVICLGINDLSRKELCNIIDIFINEPMPLEERHQRRIEKIINYEEGTYNEL